MKNWKMAAVLAAALSASGACAQVAIPENPYELGMGYCTAEPRNLEGALRMFELAAERGDARALFELGRMYGEGTEVTPKNSDEAVKWYRLAAEG